MMLVLVVEISIFMVGILIPGKMVFALKQPAAFVT